LKAGWDRTKEVAASSLKNVVTCLPTKVNAFFQQRVRIERKTKKEANKRNKKMMEENQLKLDSLLELESRVKKSSIGENSSTPVVAESVNICRSTEKLKIIYF
jgi:hypothetical protein